MKRLAASAALLLAAAVWWAARAEPQAVPEVPPGDQEIAWVHAATSTSAWERFVPGVHRVTRDWPQLHVDDRRAFLESTTATPELVLRLDGAPGRVLIRWYKLSKEASAVTWV